MDHPDHRRIGRELGIFTTDEACGTGLPLWLPAGAAVRSELESFIVDLERRHGYRHVYTPELGKRELYERSGHWQHYSDDMYPSMRLGSEEVVLRPMNCPHHILVFQAERPGLSELPWRLAELATMFRNERSGVVGGLSRTLQMTLNDGHVFCTPDQIGHEIAEMVTMVDVAYGTLDIPAPRFRLSLPSDGPKFVDDPDMWNTSVAALRSALDDLGRDYEESPGEAAFYGPKIDLEVTDPQGRSETLSTIQVDFHLPARFDLSVHHGPTRVRPVMIHRSIVSTMERMVAHLLEVHNGALPPWLAPTQVRIIGVEPVRPEYLREVRDRLQRDGLRVDMDGRDASLGARIRDATIAKIPYVGVVGPREAENGTVSLRLRDGRKLDPLSTGDVASLIHGIVADRAPGLTPD